MNDFKLGSEDLPVEFDSSDADKDLREERDPPWIALETEGEAAGDSDRQCSRAGDRQPEQLNQGIDRHEETNDALEIDVVDHVGSLLDDVVVEVQDDRYCC